MLIRLTGLPGLIRLVGLIGLLITDTCSVGLGPAGLCDDGEGERAMGEEGEVCSSVTMPVASASFLDGGGGG